MSQDLLPDPKTDLPGPADLEGLEKEGLALEHLWRVYLGQVNAAVIGMKGSSRLFESIWRRIVLDVAAGQTAAMQAVRPRFQAALEHRLDLLKRAHALARRLRERNGTAEVSDPDALLPEITELERLKAGVIDRWRTEDDLERLAVEHYPLSQSQLQRIAAAHTPPPEWYAGEEEELFQE